MNIVLALGHGAVPSIKYGGTQRVIYSLGKELAKLGHKVTFLAGKGSYADFADVKEYDPSLPLEKQIPDGTDIIHFNTHLYKKPETDIPYVCTIHDNGDQYFDINSIFVSKNHALRHGGGSTAFVYNGLDWDNYTKPDLNSKRNYFHFLAKAAWSVKNVKGAISTIKRTQHERLVVMGGTRLNFKMGFRLTLSPRISFKGMVDDTQKSQVMNHSKGLIFPVIWHEPFGLVITESMYFGCPVFGTPYGALSELVKPGTGFLSTDAQELSEHLKEAESYDRKLCHEYARDLFNSKVMALEYLKKYEAVISGKTLNDRQPHVAPVERKLPFTR